MASGLARRPTADGHLELDPPRYPTRTQRMHLTHAPFSPQPHHPAIPVVGKIFTKLPTGKAPDWVLGLIGCVLVTIAGSHIVPWGIVGLVFYVSTVPELLAARLITITVCFAFRPRCFVLFSQLNVLHVFLFLPTGISDVEFDTAANTANLTTAPTTT